MGGSPWAWHWHPVAWVLIATSAVGYCQLLFGLPVGRWKRALGQPTTGQVTCFGLGLASVATAVTWPVADLAQHWSLLARMVQQLLLVLVSAPLLLLGIPRSAYASATRNRLVDTGLRAITRPVPAALIFSTVALGCLSPDVVDAQAHSWLLDAAVEVALCLAGLVMWLPVLRLLPDGRHLSIGGRMGYLFVISILPNFPALLFIFAQHPFYAVYADHSGLFGLSPLADQQVAGAVTKLAGILVLWGTAALIWVRGEKAQNAGLDPDPLTWNDVQRELERAERRNRKRSTAG
ncbi:MAG: cytochrome c oxidase assembly protein [Actinomycetota bacterium]|nr:cytochrome c oxidase assembly protein [Actinomycetota bacterium]